MGGINCGVSSCVCWEIEMFVLLLLGIVLCLVLFSYVFFVIIDVGELIEFGIIDGSWEWYIFIFGGKVFGFCLIGVVLLVGGDW